MVNREALKKLSDMAIDCQVSQQPGYKVFSGIGTPQDAIDLKDCLNDVVLEAQALLSMIPVLNKTDDKENL